MPGFLGTPKRQSAHAGRQPAVLALALVGGLLAVLWFVFRDQLTPAVPVEVEPVALLMQGEAASRQGAPRASSELLFQASGWVEPDPWPVNVAVLTDGFVEEVFVKEGERVTNGQLVARLDAADAHLDLQEALAAQRHAAADLAAARDRWERIAALPDRDTTPSERTTVRSELDRRQAGVETAQARVDMARLALERTTIRSRMDGVVLRRFAHPGSKRRAAMDDPNSAAIVSLYDPRRLQVRVDVPLAEAGRLVAGQPARISTAMLPGRVHTGRVTRVVGQADLQRNTLQAKVEIRDPDPRLRPDVLCRVEFWNRPEMGDPASGAAGTAGGAGARGLWVAEAALSGSDASEQDVWVIDPVGQRARRRAIRVGSVSREGYRNVLEGLRANENVVTRGAENLEEGRRVSVRAGEEPDE
jgi:RND family efflux transporter MFP subunit